MSRSSRAVATEAERADRPPRPRVLLVDDRPDNLMALAAVLEPLDADLVPARSGEEALRHLLGEEFAAIVLDVQMPVLDGFETARLIKQRERTRHVPLVFLTAISGEPEHHLRGYEVGAVDYVYKPFAPEILRAKVRVFTELWQRGAIIERQRAQLEERLADLDRANAALARQGVELERSNAALERFAEIAAHELRQPLRNIEGFLDLLLSRHRDELGGEAALLAERAAGGVERARSLTSALLSYAKAGSEPLRGEPVPLGDLLEDAMGQVPALKEQAATVETDGELPTVRGDRGLLERLLVNLLDNAVKFRSSAPPRIRVRANPGARGWTVAVTDNGIGIDPTSAPRLFTVFMRQHASDERPGHGIGLAVCRRIVERHGGTIRAEPEPGGGTRISFTLPASALPGAAGAG
ncbi:MAG TPA: ATP-binding protein [Actinomycetes bacterium]|nr:ATP-binding protein [Actinomycetes bacterium]